MSLRNGDKARFGRQRKAKIRRRVLMRELRRTLMGEKPKVKPAKSKKPKA